MIAPPKHAGLSLVELLVAIALGALLLAGATTLFVNNRATYNITNELARMQENARFALETMVDDLRMAGYTGCFNGPGTNEVRNLIAGSDGLLWDPSRPIEGFDTDQNVDPTARTWLPSNHVGSASDTDLDVTTFGSDYPSDGLTIRYLEGHRNDADADGTPDLELVNAVHGGSTVITLNNVDFTTAGIVDGQPAALSDCGSADVFLVDNDPAADGNVEAEALSRTFDTTNRALFSTLGGARYFVRNNASGVPSLFRGTMVIVGGAATERADELVEGVDSLQVLYGLDTNNDNIVDSFSPADTVSDWNAVSVVRIGLLMRTPSQHGGVPATDTRYQVADKTFCSADLAGQPECEVVLQNQRFSRRAYETTVRVRNL